MGWQCSSVESVFEPLDLPMVVRTLSANANSAETLDGAIGSPLPARPTPSPPDSVATIGRARPRAGGRSRTAGIDPAAVDEERAADGAGRGSLVQPPGYKI